MFHVLSFESKDITKKGDSFVYMLCALCASLVLVWVLSAKKVNIAGGLRSGNECRKMVYEKIN